MLNQYFKGDTTELLNELSSMIADENVCSERRKGIAILVELNKYRKGAQTMLKMKSMFKLEGSFADMENVADSVRLSHVNCS